MKLMELIKPPEFTPDNQRIMNKVLSVGNTLQDAIYEDLVKVEELMKKSGNREAVTLTLAFRKEIAAAYGKYTTKLHKSLVSK